MKKPLSQEDYVYCTQCANFKITYLNDIDGEPFCVYQDRCDFWDFEDSRRLWQRPCYEEKS